jgi:putative inorganic carbon (HCO3(-)) transporter
LFDLSLRHAQVRVGAWLAAGWLIPVASGFDDRRLLLTGSLCLVGIVAAITGRFRLDRRLTYLGLAVLALGIASSALSPAPSWSALEVSYTLLLVVASVGVGLSLRTIQASPERLVALACVVPVALACIAIATIVYAALLSGFALRFPEPLGTFANIRFFNQYQTWLLPLLPAALALPAPIAKLRRPFWIAFVVTISVFFWALYWRSDGRGTGYACAIASVFVALISGRAGRRYALTMFGFALAGYLVYQIMFAGGGGDPKHLLSVAPNGRLYLWRIALDRIAAHPLLGIGPMMFAALDTGLAAHPHDAVLQWAAEWGLPAAVLALGGLATLLFQWLIFARRDARRNNRPEQWLVVAVTASLVAGSVHALVSGVVVMPASQYMMVTVIALALALYKPTPPIPLLASTRPADTILKITLVTITLAAAIYTTLFTIQDYVSRIHAQPPATPVYLRNANEPRYWSDGTLTGVLPSGSIPDSYRRD